MANSTVRFKATAFVLQLFTLSLTAFAAFYIFFSLCGGLVELRLVPAEIDGKAVFCVAEKFYSSATPGARYRKLDEVPCSTDKAEMERVMTIWYDRLNNNILACEKQREDDSLMFPFERLRTLMVGT